MVQLKGVYCAKKLDGTVYYRASFTYKSKHISLGSFSTAKEANTAYLNACELTKDIQWNTENYKENEIILSYDKYISIINYRDNHIYIKNPIYVRPKYFEYHLEPSIILKFDVDDLFYYSNHKIMKRNNHLFVSDYGMQVSILSRFGIKNYAIPGKDYLFKNGDPTDFRYSNITIINKYNGVKKEIRNGRDRYIAKIHINGDYLIGKYTTETDAAIAYNKAVDILKSNGVTKNFNTNYIEDISSIEYASRYHSIRISKRISNYNL